jgi:thioredoxin reductase (NADPH)
MPSGPRSLAIIGSGPAGYTAALYAARAELAPVLFEGSVTAGGALMTTTTVDNFPGQPDGILGPDLMSEMRRQAQRFGCEMVRDDVTRLQLTGPTKLLETGDGVHSFDAAILATGAAHKHLGLPDEERLAGNGVSSCATCDGAFYRDRPVAVVGGGDSALEEALFLTRFAASVTLIHRRGSLRGSKIMQARALAHPKIEFRWDSEVTGLVGEDRLEAITICQNSDGRTLRLDVNGLFVAIGHKPNSALFRGQVPMDEDGYVLVDHPTTATGLFGVFACGDLVDRRYRQAITAAGSGCAAALDAERYLSALPQLPRSKGRKDVPAEPPVAAAPDGGTSPVVAGVGHGASLADMLLTSPLPVLVDFWADDCAPCRLMLPVLDEIAHRYPDQLAVVKINVTTSPEVAQRYDITSAPTLKLFVGGEVARTIVGATPASKLSAALEPFLK